MADKFDELGKTGKIMRVLKEETVALDEQFNELVEAMQRIKGAQTADGLDKFRKSIEQFDSEVKKASATTTTGPAEQAANIARYFGDQIQYGLEKQRVEAGMMAAKGDNWVSGILAGKLGEQQLSLGSSIEKIAGASAAAEVMGAISEAIEAIGGLGGPLAWVIMGLVAAAKAAYDLNIEAAKLAPTISTVGFSFDGLMGSARGAITDIYRGAEGVGGIAGEAAMNSEERVSAAKVGLESFGGSLVFLGSQFERAKQYGNEYGDVVVASVARTSVELSMMANVFGMVGDEAIKMYTRIGVLTHTSEEGLPGLMTALGTQAQIMQVPLNALTTSFTQLAESVRFTGRSADSTLSQFESVSGALMKVTGNSADTLDILNDMISQGSNISPTTYMAMQGNVGNLGFGVEREAAIKATPFDRFLSVYNRVAQEMINVPVKDRLGTEGYMISQLTGAKESPELYRMIQAFQRMGGGGVISTQQIEAARSKGVVDKLTALGASIKDQQDPVKALEKSVGAIERVVVARFGTDADKKAELEEFSRQSHLVDQSNKVVGIPPYTRPLLKHPLLRH